MTGDDDVTPNGVPDEGAPLEGAARPAEPPAAGAAEAPAAEVAPPAAPPGEPAPEPAAEPAPEPAAEPAPAPRRGGETTRVIAALRAWLAERPEPTTAVPRARLAATSRRDFLLFGAGALAAVAGAWWLLPEATRARIPLLPHDRLDTLAARVGLSGARRERLLGRALTLDDDVAEALFSPTRRVRTYSPRDVTPLRNNYNGRTPGPGYLATWRLRLTGLASGRDEALDVAALRAVGAWREQITRLVCVEGWSAVARWGGLRFADLVAAFPPAPGMRWVAIRSEVNLDGKGRPDPYYVSLDLATARHPQVLLATHLDGRPLGRDHGAPLRLVAPMKLGLKNIKAITSIAYTAAEPPDYWNERGYSKYDGL